LFSTTSYADRVSIFAALEQLVGALVPRVIGPELVSSVGSVGTGSWQRNQGRGRTGLQVCAGSLIWTLTIALIGFRCAFEGASRHAAREVGLRLPYALVSGHS